MGKAGNWMKLLLRKKWLLMFSLVTVFTILPALAESPKRMIVLGIDGMDPTVLKGYMDAGLTPNLQRLASRGGFMSLDTTVPPQSPVAWSSFITGMNPGGHGLYDFLALDRTTMQPYLSSVRIFRTLDWGTIKLGNWQLPIIAEEPRLLRRGKSFWEILGEHDIPTRIFRVPANYPPVGTNLGKVISGMGTPDLKGSSGTFTYFTDDPGWKAGSISGGEVTRVAIRNGSIETSLTGLANPFRVGTPATEIEFRIDVDKESRHVTIEISDQILVLNEGEWSDWVTVEFELIPALIELQGMVRFYLKEITPNFRLYSSPINIDPRAPAQPIASPAEYAQELAEQAGPFYTQEMPEDTKALSEGVLTPAEFFAQSEIVLDERRRLLEYELNQFNAETGSAFMFFYFSSVDLRNHMLARQQDPDHPFHDENTSERMAKAMQTTYQEMDEIVGRVLEAVDENTAVVVMSDHGFSTFRTQVNLNTWLERSGYLQLSDPARRNEYDWLDGINWAETRAFAIGLNSLYINVQGRERDGIVDPADREALAREIAVRLGQWTDEDTGEHIVTQPLVREDIYSGDQLDNAPDVVVGYGFGYRASWATTSGKIPDNLLEPNDNEWSGDHCIDARLVPGVLLSNKALLLEQADLRDLTATIIAYFDIALPDQIEGKPVF